MATTSASKTTHSVNSGRAAKAPVKKTTRPASRATKSSVVSEPKTPEMPKTTRPSVKFNKDKVIATLRKPQILIPLAVLLAAVLVYLLKSWFVVAVVNGQFITRPSFESAMQAQAGKQTLSTLVTQKLLEQEAAKKGVKVSQSDVDAQVKKIDQQLAGQGQTLDQALAARGMSKGDLEEQIKLQTILQKLLANDIKVSDKEVDDYMTQNKDSLPTGESDDQLKASVKQQLEQQKLTTAAQTLVQKLQQAAHITYFINL